MAKYLYIILLVFIVTINSAQKVGKLNSSTVVNKKYSSSHSQMTSDTIVNNNNVSFIVSNKPNEDGSSSLVNFISICIGIFGIFISIGLAWRTQTNKESINRLEKELESSITELEQYRKTAEETFKTLENKHIKLLNDFSKNSQELLKLYEVIDQKDEFKTNKEFNSFYISSIVSKLSDTQPNAVIISALRMVANAVLNEALPYIDTLLDSTKLEEATKSFAFDVKQKLTKS